MSSSDGEWDSTVKQWLVDSGYCCAGGIASASDCRVYASASDDSDDAWSCVQPEQEYEIDMKDANGEVAGKAICDEAALLKDAFETGTAKNGLWFGGARHNLCRSEESMEYNDVEFHVLNCPRVGGGGGAHIIKTPNGSVVYALYNEAKNQDKGNALCCALQFADHLHRFGY